MHFDNGVFKLLQLLTSFYFVLFMLELCIDILYLATFPPTHLTEQTETKERQTFQVNTGR